MIKKGLQKTVAAGLLASLLLQQVPVAAAASGSESKSGPEITASVTLDGGAPSEEPFTVELEEVSYDAGETDTHAELETVGRYSTVEFTCPDTGGETEFTYELAFPDGKKESGSFTLLPGESHVFDRLDEGTEWEVVQKNAKKRWYGTSCEEIPEEWPEVAASDPVDVKRAGKTDTDSEKDTKAEPFDMTAESDASGKVSFPLSGLADGTYRFRMWQHGGTDEKIQYDGSVYDVAARLSDGKVSAAYLLSGTSVDEIVFKNETRKTDGLFIEIAMPELGDTDASFGFDCTVMPEEEPESFVLRSKEEKSVGIDDGSEYKITMTLPEGWDCAQSEWEGTVDGENVRIEPDVFPINNESGNMTFDDLLRMNEHVAGAASGYEDDGIMPITADAVGGQYWTFDIYYVGGRYGTHDTFAMDDFSLKYQMEFHTSEDIPADAIEIRIPSALFTFRDGTKCDPDDIAVPLAASEAEPVPAKNSAFNYMIQGEDLVFFNYKEIKAGDNEAWQVVYNDVLVMDVVDMTEWSLTATIHVAFKPEDCAYWTEGQTDDVCDKGCVDTTGDGVIDHVRGREAVDEEETAKPLHGRVNTTASLLSLTKKPCTIAGKGYGPGLYTESQVEAYIDGSLPDEYANNFGSYRYVVWEVEASGSGTQPFDLWMKESPGNGGAIVGYSGVSPETAAFRQGYASNLKTQLAGFSSLEQMCDEATWEERFYVVVAYPVSVPVGTLMTNDIDMTLVPYDLKDEAQTKKGHAEWSYQDYEWDYEGDVIGIGKSVWNDDASKANVGWNDESTDVSGWLEVFKQSVEKNRDVVPDFRFEARSQNRSFKLTHWTQDLIKDLQEGGFGQGVQVVVGQRITDMATRVTTVDDALFCYPGGTGKSYLLNGNDYYFTNIEIEQRDDGYDVWEDKYGPVETVPETEQAKAKAKQAEHADWPANMKNGIDQGIQIYAMFADKNGGNGTTNDQWEYVDRVDWPADAAGKETVRLNYTFPENLIDRHPYRVKVVHDTINYDTYCYIHLDVHIRPDSETMKTILRENPDMTTIQFENLDGVAGQMLYKGVPCASYTKDDFDWSWWSYEVQHGDGRPVTPDGVNGGYYYQDDLPDEGTNYSENGIKEFTHTLYETYLMRENSFATGKVAEKDAQVSKEGALTNDAVNGRANVVYSIAMHEGYVAGSKKIAQTLLDNGLEPPKRNEIVIYDLLPAGMNFDPSYKPTAGRVVSVSGDYYKSQPSTWQQSGVTADYQTVTTNWKNTGRTMMKFTLRYNGDALSYTLENSRIFQGWGLSFRGFWEWRDLGESDLTENICAVMTSDNSAFFAEPGQTALDNGVTEDMDFNYFGPDVDQDSHTDDQRLQAKAMVNEEIAIAAESMIQKTVRAESDKYSEFGEYAVAEPGGNYTYEISVTNTSDTATDIVIFDRLENAPVDRAGLPQENVQFESTYWHGMFQSVAVEPLSEQVKEKGGTVTVYYNTNRNAALPAGEEDPNTVLSGSGWTTAMPSNPADVKAVAVSLGSYELEPGGSVSFRIYMKAPQTGTSDDGKAATWAYNNPMFYSKGKNTGERQSVVGDSVEVRIGQPLDLEIVKEYDTSKGAIPEVRKTNQQFKMYVYDVRGEKRRPFTGHEYVLYDRLGGGWTQSGTGATGADGSILLREGQKAVFKDVPDPSRIEIEEEFDPFWVPSYEKTQNDTAYTYTVKNLPVSVLYVQKKTEGGEAGEAEFTFKLTADGKAAGNVPYWLVDHAYTDGRLPGKVEGTQQQYTGSDGTFKLKSGQIAAIIGAADIGKSYIVEETNPGSDWIIEEDERSRSGVFDIMGSSESFTNYYKWKNLYLTKTIEDRYTDGYDQDEFTFKLERVDNPGESETVTPASGIAWSIDANGTSGTTNAQGEFTCKAAAGVVTLKKLEARVTYRITETGKGQFYAIVNGGTEDVTMPLYTDSQSVTITNRWLKRPLEVTKVLLYKFDDPAEQTKAKAAVFDMVVTCDPDGKGKQEPLRNFTFRLLENGIEVAPGSASDPYGTGNSEFRTDANGGFKIKGSQTAIFDDAGVNGSKFTVTETAKEGYPQLVPGGSAPATGMMGDDGGSTKIVNGMKGSIILRKEWKGLNDGGKQFVETGKGGSPDLSAEITVKVGNAGGEKVAWPVNGNVTVTRVHDDGSIDTDTWYKGMPYRLKPGMQLVINGGDLAGYTEYEVFESNGRRIEAWGDKHIAIDQEDPAYGESVTGTVENDPSVTFVNTAEDIGEKSRISKRFVEEGVVVPKGAKLTLIVERYDGQYWNPAGDIAYVLCHGNEYESEMVEYTGYNGKIVIRSAGDGVYHWVLFPKDKVYALDIKNPKEGDLRIRELPGESDSHWGTLVGIGGVSDDTSYTMDMSEMDRTGETVKEAFVNTVGETQIQAEKTVLHPTDQEFTFTLKRITEVDGAVYSRDNGITEQNYNQAITETSPGANVEYRIYDSETGEQIGTGKTDAWGKFTLKGGQYAEFDVPERTLWTVTEDVAPGFTLKQLNEKFGQDKTTKLADNMMLFGSDNDYKKEPNNIKVKYAVAIYGIGQDKDRDGKVLVTFGPATGKNYTHSHKEHASDKTCIHNMTWQEIIDKAMSDPNALQDCLTNGCTKSVELTIGGPLMGEAVDPMEDGDGASILFDSISENYRNWNNIASNTGGWPASRIRTTLNGKDDRNSSVAGNDLLSESEALISAFPEELRNAIVEKTVKSDTVYDSTLPVNVGTTYDKLWLFSGRELRTGDPANDVRENESNVSTGYYQRASELGISTSTYVNLKGYKESGSTDYWWLRSLYRHNSYYVYGVTSSGRWTDYDDANVASHGVAPGFCIPMKQPEYTVIIDAGAGNITWDSEWMGYQQGVHKAVREHVTEGTQITLPTNEPVMLSTAIRYEPSTAAESLTVDVSERETGPASRAEEVKYAGITNEIVNGIGKKKRKRSK